MNYYDQIAVGYNDLHADEQRKKLTTIRDNLGFTPKNVLDVGCGTGLSAEFFPNTTGIDSSKEMLRQANCPTVQGSAEHLPFPDKSFDLVLSVTALHNFQNTEKCLREIQRVGRNYAITILRKAHTFDTIYRLVKKHFTVKKSIVEDKDLILMLI